MENETELEPAPIDLIATFQRCANYPRDYAGVIALAQGLRKASDRYEILMQAIVDRCAETSQFCPTDAELLNAALSMRDTLDRALQDANDKKEKSEWERKHGKPIPWTAELCLRCGAHPHSSDCGPQCHEAHSANCASLPMNNLFHSMTPPVDREGRPIRHDGTGWKLA